MPARPPETKFYEDEKAETLWRDLSRLYEENPKTFETVANDILVQIRENKGQSVDEWQT